MKILVFDDNELHRNAAVEQLAEDHELTVIETYDEAEDALKSRIDKKRVRQFLAEAGFSNRPRFGTDEWRTFYSAELKAEKEATIHPDFDIVLTDLLVPASSRNQGGKGNNYVGQEMPLGTVIAFLAIKIGVKHVGVITDLNHHNHPASASLDALGGYSGRPFDIGDTRIVFASNFTNFVEELEVEVKDWKKAVQVLTESSQE